MPVIELRDVEGNITRIRAMRKLGGDTRSSAIKHKDSVLDDAHDAVVNGNAVPDLHS